MNNRLNELYTTTNHTFADGNVKYWEYEWLFDFIFQFTIQDIDELEKLISNLQSYCKNTSISDLKLDDIYVFDCEEQGKLLYIAGDMDETQLVYRHSDNQFIIYHPYFTKEVMIVNPENLSVYLRYLVSIFKSNIFEQTIFFEHIKQ